MAGGVKIRWRVSVYSGSSGREGVNVRVDDYGIRPGGRKGREGVYLWVYMNRKGGEGKERT